ncbi:uncharacterized protein LOC142159408 [Mixophyes fleayi]|uniref:uncharacterized protein LOC142159408 n=1 Tax=Mixophyes fleayi TaxID=3061075 RepID=UPI003F4E3EAA
MRHTGQAPHMFGDLTLTFSDEEWMGLAAWQRDLYRTVMRDTMELCNSLGFMFLKREELEPSDSRPVQESIEERTVTPAPTAVIEEIAGKNFIIQVTGTPAIQEDGDNISTPRTETAEIHLSAGNLFFPQNSKISPIHRTLFPPRSVTPMITESPEEDFIHGGPPTSTRQEGRRDCFIAWDTETSFIQETRASYEESFRTGSTEFTTTNAEDICYLKDGVRTSCPPGTVLCGSRVDMVIGSDEQTFTSDIIPDSDYLTIIQVEEINVALEKEVKTIHREGWDVHPDDSIVPWSIWDSQGDAAFPLALMGPPNTSYYQYPWSDKESILAADTSQWSDQLGPGAVEEGGAGAASVSSVVLGTVDLDDTSTQESLLGERLYKCSICSKSFLYKLHLEHHEKLHMKKTFECPSCHRHFISNRFLQEHQRKHHSLLHSDSPAKRVDRAKRTPGGAQNHLCTQCNRTFSQLVGLHRHQKIHSRNNILPKVTAPPPRKVYKLPLLHPSEGRKTEPRVDPSGEAFTKLHRHLQLSTAFLQNLITSTCGFQYD